MPTQQQTQFEAFAKKEGRKSAQILSNLGKKKVFIDALSTELGQELLKDVLRMSESKLNKIINEDANTMDKAMFKVCKFLAHKWTDRVNSYNHGLQKFNLGS